jgi:hypothetical protein
MMSRHLSSRVLPISALLLLVIFKFQNCAPAPEMLNASSVGGDSESQVRIVDRWSEQKVAFLSPAHAVAPEEQSLSLQGLCVGSEKGQLIEFQVILIEDSPHVVANGTVECVMGGFELPISDLKLKSCNERLQVRAARLGENENYAETILQLDCKS